MSAVTTIASFLVAAEERGHNFWYPRLAGYTVVLCAIVLFCGSQGGRHQRGAQRLVAGPDPDTTEIGIPGSALPHPRAADSCTAVEERVELGVVHAGLP